jgi:hypothetical protein
VALLTLSTAQLITLTRSASSRCEVVHEERVQTLCHAAWCRRSRRATRVPLFGFAAALVAVLGFGFMRLASPLPAAQGVSVAAIAPREDLFATISDMNPGTLMPGTAPQRAEAGGRFTPAVAAQPLRRHSAGSVGAGSRRRSSDQPNLPPVWNSPVRFQELGTCFGYVRLIRQYTLRYTFSSLRRTSPSARVGATR